MIAANQKGVTELARMVAEFGLNVVYDYMRHVQDNAEESVRRVIGALKDGAHLHSQPGQTTLMIFSHTSNHRFLNIGSLVFTHKDSSRIYTHA